MRIIIPSGTPHEEAISRARGRKKVGRKHLHQPRGRAREKQRMTPILRERQRLAHRRKFNALVAAYWRGEVETFPAPATRI